MEQARLVWNTIYIQKRNTPQALVNPTLFLMQRNGGTEKFSIRCHKSWHPKLIMKEHCRFSHIKVSWHSVSYSREVLLQFPLEIVRDVGIYYKVHWYIWHLETIKNIIEWNFFDRICSRNLTTDFLLHLKLISYMNLDLYFLFLHEHKAEKQCRKVTRESDKHISIYSKLFYCRYKV